MGPFLARLPLVLGIALVGFGIYVKVRVADAEGVLAMGLGCLLIGVWLTQTVADWADGRRKGGGGDAEGGGGDG